jgi:hypothetical protein
MLPWSKRMQACLYGPAAGGDFLPLPSASPWRHHLQQDRAAGSEMIWKDKRLAAAIEQGNGDRITASGRQAVDAQQHSIGVHKGVAAK